MKTKDSGAQNRAKRKRRMVEDVKMSECMEQFVKKTKVKSNFSFIIIINKTHNFLR